MIKHKQSRLLVAGSVIAAIAFIGTGIGLSFRLDPETGQWFWALPRDVLYQWNTAIGGILLAAAVSFFLPIDWTHGRTPNERIAANICLAAIWMILIYAMARH